MWTEKNAHMVYIFKQIYIIVFKEYDNEKSMILILQIPASNTSK